MNNELTFFLYVTNYIEVESKLLFMNVYDALKIRFVKIDKDQTILEIPITDAILQPAGIIHGGINAFMAEATASIAAKENVSEDKTVLGLSVNTNQIRSVSLKTGNALQAVAIPEHRGRTTQVWSVKTYVDGIGKATTVSTVTLYIKDK
nr:PaaI family thioesterase [Oenococcus oeni]